MGTFSADPTNAAVLLAGGSGSRMRGSVDDKILAPLRGQPVFYYSLAAFVATGAFGEYIVVCRDQSQEDKLRTIVANHFPAGLVVRWARGGAERQDSVLNGLLAAAAAARYVFIHDCARPLVRSASILELLAAVGRSGAAVLAHRIADTIKRVDEINVTQRPVQLVDLDRRRLWGMETPQAFDRELILGAYRAVAAAGGQVTDDTAAVSGMGTKVEIVENTAPNPKLTTAADLALIEFLLAAGQGQG